MRKKKISTQPLEKPYKINDRRGIDKQANLYPTLTGNNSYGMYRQRYYWVGDTKKTVTPSDRTEQIRFGRSLFAGCPDLGGALLSKASWVVGPGSFSPIFTGTDTEWGNEAERWLLNQFFPICSAMGPNYPFTTLLNLSSLAIDVDGDSGLYLTTTRDGFPQVGMVPSHRIGCRSGETVVKTGRFSGYEINDGVIINDSGRTIGYRILGATPEDDYDVSAANFQLLYEPEWSDQYRGISRIARSVTDWASQDDINEFIIRGVKLASSIGLIHKTEDGSGNDTGFLAVGADDSTQIAVPNDVTVTPIAGGEIYFMKAGANESLESLKDERPSPNTEAFISRIQKRAMYSIGWPQELLDPSKIGGASVRLIQDLVRKTIAQRQQTIERRAKLIVTFAVAKAMNLGLISQNNDDWWSWSFTKGGMLTVDNGNENAADREGYKLGTTSLAEISSKKGQDWVELRAQAQRETEDLLTRAQEVSNKFGISMESALNLLSQRTPNTAPLTTTPQPTEQPVQ